MNIYNGLLYHGKEQLYLEQLPINLCTLHSYEFDVHNNWNVIEEFAKYIGGREDIWYATNIEIYDYVAAYKQLVFCMNGKKVYNPTSQILYFYNGLENYKVNPGEMVYL